MRFFDVFTVAVVAFVPFKGFFAVGKLVEELSEEVEEDLLRGVSSFKTGEVDGEPFFVVEDDDDSFRIAGNEGFSGIFGAELLVIFLMLMGFDPLLDALLPFVELLLELFVIGIMPFTLVPPEAILVALFLAASWAMCSMAARSSACFSKSFSSFSA